MVRNHIFEIICSTIIDWLGFLFSLTELVARRAPMIVVIIAINFSSLFRMGS